MIEIIAGRLHGLVTQEIGNNANYAGVTDPDFGAPLTPQICVGICPIMSPVE